MRNDSIEILKEAAALAIQILDHPAVTPGHLLYALLAAPKYEKVLETFFRENHSSLTEVRKLLQDRLKKLEKTEFKPTLKECGNLTVQAAHFITGVDEWFSADRSGYCLPFIWLLEFVHLGDEDFTARLLTEHCKLDKAILFAEISRLEQQKFDDLPEDYTGRRSLRDFLLNLVNVEIIHLTEDATSLAYAYHHKYLMPEHLLLGFLRRDQSKDFLATVINKKNAEALDALEAHLVEFLNENAETRKETEMPVPVPAFYELTRHIFDLAQQRVQKSLCFPALFVMAVLDLDTPCAAWLRKVGCKAKYLMDFLGSQPRKTRKEDALDENFTKLFQDEEEFPHEYDFDPTELATSDIDFPFDDDETPKADDLETYAVELVDLARKGKIDALIGRKEELDRLIEVLHKKRSSNAMIVGNEGVGKTALAEGLALRIANGEVPPTLKDFKIYSLNLGAMVAGTEFRGMFEQRLQNCIKAIAEQPNCFLFVDEIHTLLGAGSGGREGTLDAGNILKPYLSRGELRCIGATTYNEYQNRILKDRAFARRFMEINIGEPSTEDTFQILRGLAPAYQKYHKVTYTEEILRHIVELSERFITGKFFPDKAIEVMDECGAHFHSGLAKGKKVTKADVERVVCRIANLPAITAQNDDRNRLRTLEENLKKNIFGQDEAIQELVRRVKVAKAGFQDARRPLLSAFLCGPTGCGKTELARQLASELGIGFVKFDMSEYSEEYAASRLIGSAPGYVGYDRPGALTEPVIQTPHCLLLLDEIEKAHPVVFNLLLQVLDEGRLTDNKGREASFRNAIILMTSNAGSRAAAESINLLGFAKSADDQTQNRQEIIQRVLKKTFPPEFRNRLQVTVMMNDLNRQALEDIVRKTCAQANQLLKKQNASIDLTSAAVAQLAALAEEEHLGGRPVERLFDQMVRQKIVDEMLFGKLASGGRVSIDFHDGEFQYDYQADAPASRGA